MRFESVDRQRWPRHAWIVTATAGVLLLGPCGCGTVRLEVPPDRLDVRLLEADEPAEIYVERTLWFWLWGGKAISDNTTKTDIEHYDLKEVRVRTEQHMLDFLTLPFTVPFTIVRRTLIVEGNTGRAIRRNREDLLSGEDR